ncbi:OmpA/MotB family protein [Desulfovibrio oxyclinae]|uniref:OmpA/MotB family protein n=1 Tax=Desulfovibrio oxyclinae TaxID=63560 RepID=UPI0003619EB4|nr:OmpA family protein [Desulfovibrio oxyclinae]
MARKKKKACEPMALWLVTFSDLVTLLLTFFVLLLTMSSMDNTLLTTVTVTQADLGLLSARGSGRVSAKERLVAELMEKPWEVLEKQNRLKDLLFPDEVLPPEINRQELEENLTVLSKWDGVGLVFTDRLLFEPGGTRLSDTGRELLDALVPIMTATSAPIDVAGYADSVDDAPDPWQVSKERAISVLTFLREAGLTSDRLAISAYGDTRPAVAGDSPEARSRNRRVEILLKTQRPIGGYP